MNRFFIAVVALVLGFAGVAIAQTPFQDSRQAAGDQYGVTAQGATPAIPPTTPPAAPSTPDEGGTAGDNDSGAEDGSDTQDDGGVAGDGDGDTPATGSAGTGSGAAGAASPAVAARSTIGFVSTRGSLEDLLTRIVGLPGLSVELGQLDERLLGDLAAGTPFAGLGGGDLDEEKLAEFSEALGVDLVTGGPLAVRLAEALDADGAPRPLTGLVATRDVSNLSDGQKTIVDAVLTGILEGAVGEDIPVVAVEETGNDPSNVEFFKKVDGVSIVDNVDAPAGAASLTALLAGATVGHYGTEQGADAESAPTIDPDTSSATVSGSGDGGGVSIILVIGICMVALVAGRAGAMRLRRSSPLA